MPLTDAAIRSAKPAEKPQKLFDDGGLYLEIVPSGGKWWRLKYRFGGKEKRISLPATATASSGGKHPLQRGRTYSDLRQIAGRG